MNVVLVSKLNASRLKMHGVFVSKKRMSGLRANSANRKKKRVVVLQQIISIRHALKTIK